MNQGKMHDVWHFILFKYKTLIHTFLKNHNLTLISVKINRTILNPII